MGIAAAGMFFVSHAAAYTVEEPGVVSVDSTVEQIASENHRAAAVPIRSTLDANGTSSHESVSIKTVVPSSTSAAKVRDIRSSSQIADTVQTLSPRSAEIGIQSTSIKPELYVIASAQPSTYRFLGTDTVPESAPTTSTQSDHYVSRFLGTDTVPESAPTTSTQSDHYMKRFVSYETIELEQNIISDDVFTIVYDHTLEHNELVITSNNTALSRIVVTEQTDNPRLNFERMLETDTGENTTVTYPNDLEMNVVFDGIRADLMMENSTEITGPADWDGVMNLPVFEEVSAVPEIGGNVSSVLNVGLNDDMLVFDVPVSIIFDGKAGHDVLFQRGDKITPIHTTCDQNDAGAVSLMLNGTGECKMDEGRDLVVWTFHFTRFITTTVPLSHEPETVTSGVVTEPPGVVTEPPRSRQVTDTSGVQVPATPVANLVRSVQTPGSTYGGSSSGGGGGGGGAGGGQVSNASPLLAIYDMCGTDDGMVRVVAESARGGGVDITLISPNGETYRGVQQPRMTADRYVTTDMVLQPPRLFVFDFDTGVATMDLFTLVITDGGDRSSRHPIILDQCTGYEEMPSVSGVTLVQPVDMDLLSLPPLQSPTAPAPSPPQALATSPPEPPLQDPVRPLVATVVPGDGGTSILTYNDTAYKIRHDPHIVITGMEIHPEGKTVSVMIQDMPPGGATVSIELPEGIIRGPTAVTAPDGRLLDSTIRDNRITIELPEDTSEFMVSGTWVVPEFGAATILVVSAALAASLALARATGRGRIYMR